ncbi:13011_t:CDS:2 [Dentiscutata erythropus]|uniref:13011_t:CDS:1 n=1 Tax=Dentiscutata erythropus TaxID=1348616 RepID=A0A9N9AHB3_9GLOM|nr:13011_t:CDS:2 [Dentiscutata erythropus]
MPEKLRDPWARREAWRNQPPFTFRHSIRHIWPGFTWGLGAFAIYLAYDTLFVRDSHHIDGSKSHNEGATTQRQHY